MMMPAGHGNYDDFIQPVCTLGCLNMMNTFRNVKHGWKFIFSNPLVNMAGEK